MNKLEWWFNKWRLQVSTHKCSYNIYTQDNIPILVRNDTLKLKIFNEFLKADYNLTYLGMTLNRKLNFNSHTAIIKSRCPKSQIFYISQTEKTSH